MAISEYTRLALEEAKKNVSLKTHFVHFCSEKKFSLDCIPLFENFCYVLSLVKVHQKEEIIHAKKLLQTLLCFQTKTGNFPTYFHEFPYGSSGFQAFKCFLPLFFLWKFYRNILDKDSIQTALQKLIFFMEEKKQTSVMAKLQALLCKSIFSKQEKLDEIFFLWKALEKTSFSVEEFSFFLVAFQFLDQKHFTVEKIWKQVRKSFHPALQTFYAPYLKQKYEKFFPQTSLCDFFCIEDFSLVKKRYSPCVFLSSSLVFITHPVKKMPLQSGFFTTQPFRIYWLEEEKIHSLISYEPFEKIEKKQDVTYLYLSLNKEIFLEKYDLFECTFFCSFLHANIFVEGKKASTFQLGELVQICCPHQKFEMCFFLQEGKGNFFGHISLGNRDTQIEKEPFSAYDWKIGLRTVERKSDCNLCIRIRSL